LVVKRILKEDENRMKACCGFRNSPE